MRQIFILILCISIFSCKSDKKRKGAPIIKSTNKVGIKKIQTTNKDSIVEYINVNGEEYVNQIWVVNKKNDTIGGNYFEAIFKDTTQLGEVTEFRFILEPRISYNSDMYILLPTYDEELKDDFSNLFEIELDTFYSLKNDKIPHPELTELDLPLNLIVHFGLIYEESGSKRVRGVIIERNKLNNKNFGRRLFFDKSLYVKE
ncbi:hypothetical protein C1T31_06450 [Hanstruepera neustonica]|uniref:Lipoprotein n=1 Tax=Hanstruepera neustonica TaxID=1445657 RepID=A0A2K1E109_9FLAO|nr:hypothetical protein [Hanstruepera neustonica]PNQ73958.1 hypothetical protein C1T31_06450 [Hanstruepera neustonica]